MVNEKQGKLARALQLVELLREEPQLTRDELAERLSITVRQLYLDKTALAEAGFIYNWDRTRRKHRVESDPFRQTVSISYGEALALAIAVRVLDRGGEKALADRAKAGLHKLLTAATEDSSSIVANELLAQCSTDGTKSGPVGTEPQLIEDVAKAMAFRRAIHINYHKQTNVSESKTIHVYSIFAGGQDGIALYADAWDTVKKQYRTYRLSRVSDWKLGNSFKPRADYSYSDRSEYVWQAYGFGEAGKEVRLYVSPCKASQVKEQLRHPSQKIVTRADGSLDLTYKVAYPEEVLWWSFLWEGHIHVDQPKELVEKARIVTKRLMEAYNIVSSVETLHTTAGHEPLPEGTKP